MLRFLNQLFRDFRTTSLARGGGRAPRRAMLQLEGLEDRLVLSSATLFGSTLVVNLTPGGESTGEGGLNFPIPEQVEIQVDKAHPTKLDVVDLGSGLSLFGHSPPPGQLLGQFPIASIKTALVNLSSVDDVIVDDSNGLPFADGTHVALSATTNEFNSLILTGSRGIKGGETYTAGNGTQAASLTLGRTTYEIGSNVGAVNDSLKTTIPLVVKAFGQSVLLFGSAGGTQELTGLSKGGAGDILTYSNKVGVDLKMFSDNAVADLEATTAAFGEHSLVVDLFGKGEGAVINSTPIGVTTSVVAHGASDVVNVDANSSPVFIGGNSTTVVNIGDGPGAGNTSPINADVFVRGVQLVRILDGGNHTTQENVLVTESTISGTGLFGNNAVVVHYHNIGKLDIFSGQEFEKYAIAGSTPTASFRNPIEIDGASEGGLFVTVGVDPRSNLDLVLHNASTGRLSGDLIFTALGATFNPSTPPTSDNFAPTLSGSEVAAFAGGAHSIVDFSDFSEVIAINHLIPVNPFCGGYGETAW
jgi:hypothetical protein